MDLQEMSLLVVDSAPDVRPGIAATVSKWHVPDTRLSIHSARTPHEALSRANAEIFDAIVIDAPTNESLELIADFTRNSPESAVIVLPAAECHSNVSQAIRLGAQEVLSRQDLLLPTCGERLVMAVERKRRESLRDGQSHVLDLLAKGYPLATVLNALTKDLERQHPEMLCSILILDEDGKRLLHGAAPSLPEKFNAIVHGIEIGPNKGSCGTAVWLGRPIIVTDIRTDPLWTGYREVAEEFGLAACWSQPIASASGKLLGTFAVYFRTPRRPKHAELRIIERAASVAGIAISQRQTEIALRYRFDFEKLIFSISTRFISTSSDSIEGEIHRALESIGQFAGADRSSIFLLSEDGAHASNSHEWHRAGVSSHRERLQHINIGGYEWLRSKLEHHEVIYIRTPEDLPANAVTERDELKLRQVRSMLAVPMAHGRHLLGFVNLETTTESKVWSADAVALLKMSAQIFSNAFERKRFEEELLHSREEFLRNEAQLRLTFDTAHIGMATCALDGRLLSVNNAFCRMLGFESHELLQRSFSDISHPEDRTIARRKLRDLLRGYVSHIEIERRFLAKNGSVICTMKRLGAVFDSRKKPAYLVAEIEDITEKKKWEAEYLKACKLESLGVLAGGIAHDFNNILMAILGAVSFTKLEVEPNGRVYERFEDIERAVYRARDLTQQLLTFSKGGVPITSSASIADLIRETVGFTLSGTDISWSLNASSDLWPVQVDEGQISQVINNLILNAAQAMPDGGCIAVSCENARVHMRSSEYGPPLRAGRYVRIRFQDQGCGIPLENVPKVFDPFFTTKEAGNGLGLATTYSIIKRHQGHIEVESTGPAGTTFSIYLPASRSKAVRQRRPAFELQLGHGRVLLMDDEAMVRKVAGSMLQRLGYDVDYAVNGVEAVEMYQRARSDGHPFDVVIMDLTVPGGMGGRLAIRRLKKLDPQVRAIVSSGYAGGPVMAEYRKYGFVGVMAKPYEITTLSSVLSEVLLERTE